MEFHRVSDSGCRWHDSPISTQSWHLVRSQPCFKATTPVRTYRPVPFHPSRSADRVILRTKFKLTSSLLLDLSVHELSARCSDRPLVDSQGLIYGKNRRPERTGQGFCHDIFACLASMGSTDQLDIRVRRRLVRQSVVVFRSAHHHSKTPDPPHPARTPT